MREKAQEDSDFALGALASLQVSFLFCTLAVCGFLIASKQTAHWFLFPAWFCGVLIGCDAVDWFRGRLRLYDPAGIIGLLGVHFFFLAPLLHVTWNSWMQYIQPPPDWRDWLGGMAIVNAVGLLLYRGARSRAAVWGRHDAKETFWCLDRKRLALSAGCGLAVSGILQAWVYAHEGGIAGYVETFTEATVAVYPQAFNGMGWIFMLSESFPILAVIYFVACTGHLRIVRTWPVIISVLLGTFILQMLFGGLRGERSNTIWGLFCAAGIIHLWVRPLTKKVVFAGLIFLTAFMYLYGFYKQLGLNAWNALRAGTKTSELSESTGRTFDSLVLGDFGRADVQAFLLYRLSMPNHDYHYAWGRTFFGAAVLLVPRALWPNRPPTKVKEGTEAQYGMGSWDERHWTSAHVYGLAGEAMLNFGPLAVPFAYAIFGVLVGRLQRLCFALRHGDTRLLLCPFLVNMCFLLLLSDSDNLVFNFIKNGFVPTLIVCFGSTMLRYSKMERSAPSHLRRTAREPARGDSRRASETP